ncbi:MAG: helix-turn-helix domain-containing protein [Pyrinomonadaceae bacterium]
MELRKEGASGSYGSVLDERSYEGIVAYELQFDAGRKMPERSLTGTFFSILLDGSYSETLGKNVAALPPLTTIFHPSGITHTNPIGQSRLRMFSVELQNQWLEKICESKPPHCSIHLPGSELSRLTLKLHEEYRNGDRWAPIAIEGLVLEMLAVVARHKNGRRRRPPAWLPEVTTLLQARFQDNLTIRQLASEVGVHPVYLSRVFRQFKGESISDYVQNLRVQFTCQLLTDTGQTLSEIAIAAGFADQSHFTRVFRRLTGLTPGAFRNLLSQRRASSPTNVSVGTIHK